MVPDDRKPASITETQQWTQSIRKEFDTQGIRYANNSIQYSTILLQAEALVYSILKEREDAIDTSTIVRAERPLPLTSQWKKRKATNVEMGVTVSL